MATGEGFGEAPTLPSDTPPSKPAPVTLAAEELLADRYRVVRFIARGGMGEVYEAEDFVLGKRVALKTIRSDVVRDDEAMARFRREIKIAHEVTHPNVCRVHDVGFATRPGGDVVFLTMELLDGETLAARLQRTGPLSLEEVQPIARQIAAALAAAHRLKVIHRDLKSANVMLVGDRAVVTDFGLARQPHAGESAVTREGGGQMVGTPAYMAPEQVTGEGLTPAADVYAFGVVLYELVTGRLPFDGNTPLAMAARRLEGTPSAPRLHAPHLDRHWEAIILRCLARRPADRYPDGAALALALAPIARPWPRWPLAALAGAGVAVAILLWPRAPRRDPAPRAGRPAVAVGVLRNATGDAARDWIGSVLAETLALELGADGRVQVLPADVGAGTLVAGSYRAAAAGRLRVELHTTGGGLALAEEGTEEQVLDVAARLAAGLRGELGLPATAAGMRANLPATTLAARHFAAGSARLRDRACVAAQTLLEQATAADPRFALAHAALADAWRCLGYDARAREEIRRAFDLATTLPVKQRLAIEARYFTLTGNRKQALEVARRLWALYPDDLEIGLQLAGFYEVDARLAFAALRNLPPPLSENPRIDLAEIPGQPYNDTLESMVAIARRAQARAAAAGNQALLAQAYGAEASPLVRIGHAADAERAGRLSRDAAVAVGNRSAEANAAVMIGMALFHESHLAEAARTIEEAATIARELGDGENLGIALQRLALIYVRKGDLALARGRLEELRGWSAERQRLGGLAVTTYLIAQVALAEGDARAARLRVDEGTAFARADGKGLEVQFLPADIPAAEDDAAAAGAALEAQLAYATRVGAEVNIAQSLIALGYLDLRHDSAGAEARARAAIEHLEKLHGSLPQHQAYARALLAEALLAEGKKTEALVEIARAEPALAGSEWPLVRVRGTIASARVRSAVGDGAPEALVRLVAEEETAVRAGLVALALEARLARGAIELASGQPVAARRRLDALARDADRRGFRYLARAARAAR